MARGAVSIRRRPRPGLTTFNATWTLTWQLVAEGTGTRLFLEHSGFNLDDKRERDAYDRMGRGWRDILPRLAAMISS